jgi:hypothetical protein
MLPALTAAVRNENVGRAELSSFFVGPARSRLDRSRKPEEQARKPLANRLQKCQGPPGE